MDIPTLITRYIVITYKLIILLCNIGIYTLHDVLRYVNTINVTCNPKVEGVILAGVLSRIIHLDYGIAKI